MASKKIRGTSHKVTRDDEQGQSTTKHKRKSREIREEYDATFRSIPTGEQYEHLRLIIEWLVGPAALLAYILYWPW